MSREEVVEGTAEAPCGRGVSLITSWEVVEVLPGANRTSLPCPAGRKGIEVHTVLTDVKESMTECTHGADSVEGALSVFMSRRKEEQAKTFATSESHQVASRTSASWVGGKKIGHFDRSEKGGRASNSNGFDSVGDSAVRGKTFGTGVDNFREPGG